jgi:proline iminopeptidase
MVPDEEEAIGILEQRLHRAPGLSVEMLKHKIFGAFESDLEFRLVMWAAAPLYSESFNANSALQGAIGTVYNAESHSESSSSSCIICSKQARGLTLIR